MNAQDNERIEVKEIRGLVSDNVREALREMDAIGSGTGAKNTFYHADINPRAYEHLTPEQWDFAVDKLERNLGLEGHARFIVEHTKDDRIHRHVVWSRVDPDTMTVVSDSHNFRVHEQTSRELEEHFGHEPVASSLTRENGEKRPDRRPANWEVFRGQRSHIDPQDVKREVTELWQQADSGAAFAAALDAHGYVLCMGERRVFVVLDAAGDSHSLARRIEGVNTAALRERMADIDSDALPSVSEGRDIIAQHRQAAEDANRRAIDPAQLVSAIAPAPPKLPGDPGFSYLANIHDDEPAPLWTVDDIIAANANRKNDAGVAGNARERISDYAAPINDALMAGEDVPARDGLSWYMRMQTVLANTIESVADWSRQRYQSFVENLRWNREDTRDNPDKSEPEIGG